MVLRAAYQSDRASQWIAERAKINAVMLPFTVGGDEQRKTSTGSSTTRSRVSSGNAMTMTTADLSILLPALAAGLLVTATHVPLGMQVLARGIVFIDLAIAHIAGCGVLVADRWASASKAQAPNSLHWSPRSAERSCSHGPSAAGRTCRRRSSASCSCWRPQAACCCSPGNVHGSEHLRDLLVGQILWVQPIRLGWAAAVYAVLLALWFGARREPGPRRLLRAVRDCRDDLGAARRRVPRVRDAHRAAAGDAADDESPARRPRGPSGRRDTRSGSSCRLRSTCRPGR
jgi:hypothetical protein